MAFTDAARPRRNPESGAVRLRTVRLQARHSCELALLSCLPFSNLLADIQHPELEVAEPLRGKRLGRNLFWGFGYESFQ
jgi:hypothetical protein